jgi:tetratricopeptide (TPR) repeat protein
LNVEISPPLEAICLKAMALKPEDRYATPRALIDDIKNWLADEPVIAWPEPWTVKTRRWMARHRTLVTGVAAALIVGVVSLSVATVLLAQANDVIQKKNTDLTDANKTIRKQNEDIKKEVDEKEKQRKLAESRLRQSLDAVGLFANDARRYTEDAVVPAESRRRLYEVLTTQLERQVDQEPGEATIDSLRNKTWMYQTLCSVTLDFYDFPRSEAWFNKGLATVEQWSKLRPDDPLALGFRATLLNLRGNGLKSERKLDAARPVFAEALKIRRKLVGDPDVDVPAKIDALTALADSLDSLDQFEESITLRKKVLKSFEKDELAAGKEMDEARFDANKARYPEALRKYRAAKDRSYVYRDALCGTYHKAGLHASDYQKRKDYFIQADNLSRDLMKERPTNRNALQRWAYNAKMFGELEHNFGELAEKDGKKEEAAKFFALAKDHYKQLNDISRKLATANELVAGLRDYSRSYYTLGLMEERVDKNPTKARDHYQTSLDMRRLAMADYSNSPMSAHLQIDMFFSQIALGQIRETMDRVSDLMFVFLDEPEAQYRLACICALAVEGIEARAKPNPLPAEDQRLVLRYRQMAFACLQKSHDDGFKDFFQTGIDADFTSLRGDPRMKEFEATYHYQLGRIEKNKGEDRKAREHFEKSKWLCDEWLKANKPEQRHKRVKIDWLCAHVQLGNAAEAVKMADTLRPELGNNAQAILKLARVYAQASIVVDDAKLREEYREKALATLEDASKALTVPRLGAEDDLDPIRGEPRFQALLEQAKKQKSR